MTLNNMYQKQSKTQKERILERLRAAGQKGVLVYEFTMPRPMGGDGVMPYGARILELRKEGFNIINKTPGHFVLEEEAQMRLL